MFFEFNKTLCETYTGLDPIKLLDYPAEDVFDLINGLIAHNGRREKEDTTGKNGVIRRKAGDNWF